MAPRPSAEHADAVTRRLQQLAESPAAPGPDPQRRDEEPAGALFPGAPDPAGDHGSASPASAPSAGTVTLPEPGRHAATRGRPVRGRVRDGVAARAREVCPEQLRGRWALGPAQVAVVVLLAALGLVVTAWWLLRADADPVPVQGSTAGEPLVPVGQESSASTPSPSATDGTTAAAGEPGPEASSPGARGAAASPAGEEVVVHVAGKVRRPGIVSLPNGARVVDAVEQAGGPRKGVDLTALNLARILVDGEQIVVGAPRPSGAGAAGAGNGGTASSAPGSGGSGTETVSLNSADQAALEELPGVGPVTAEAILEWRAEHGGFSSVEELLEVSGIGEATLAEISPHVTP